MSPRKKNKDDRSASITRSKSTKTQPTLDAGEDRESGDEEVDSRPCPKCDMPVEESPSPECQSCEFKFHIACAGFTKKDYDYLTKSAMASQMSWNCKTCNVGLKAVKSDVQKLQLKHNQLASELKEVADKQSDTDTKLTGLQDSLKETDACVEAMKSTLSMSNIMNEMEERLKRKSTLMMFYVPEATGEDSDEKSRDDLDTANSFITNDLKTANTPVTSCNRLGPKNGQEGPRALLLNFQKPDHATRIMKARWKLGSKRLKYVIAPNQTKMEREEQEALRKEVKELNANLKEKNKKWVIRNNKPFLKTETQGQGS